MVAVGEEVAADRVLLGRNRQCWLEQLKLHLEDFY